MSKFESRCLAVVALSVLLAMGMPHAVAATFIEGTAKPLSQSEIAAIKGIKIGNTIYSGDLMYRVPDLQTFGFKSNLWPYGQLPIQFRQDIDDAMRQAFFQACRAWSERSPIRCVSRTNEPDFILVESHNGAGCGGQHNVSCSFVGRVGGEQTLSVYTSHWNIQSVLQHEIGHAIGMVHEQSRPDRDIFVYVNFHNMKSGAEGQFRIQRDANTFNEYDLESIMHYGNCSFSKHIGCTVNTLSLQTLEPRACDRTRVGGNAITELDLDGVRHAYTPLVQGIFERSRSSRCGTHKLNQKQTLALCGSGCTAASPINFTKVDEHSGSDCGGFFVDPDYQGICKSTKKEYVKHWTDIDELSCWSSGLLATRFEWWVQCGCSSQSLSAICTNYSGSIDQKKLAQLLQNGSPNEQAAAHYLGEFEKWNAKGKLESGVHSLVTNIVMRDILLPDFKERLFELLCKIRIVIEARQITKPSYTLSLNTFQKLAAQSGF